MLFKKNRTHFSVIQILCLIQPKIEKIKIFSRIFRLDHVLLRFSWLYIETFFFIWQKKGKFSTFKEIDENEYSKTYRLKFKNNKYEKPVSANVYQKTKTGTLYYLIQLEGSKKAISAFAEEEYCLDESVTKRFKEK